MHRNYQIVPPSRSVVLLSALAGMKVAQARLDRCRRAAAETKLGIVNKGGSC
jgi:hypothetical protein